MSELIHRALLVGNSIFENDPHNLPTLKGPANDVRILENVLTHQQVGLHQPENVEILLDRTRDEIVGRIEDFFCNANPDHQLLFYYSGHGELDRFSNLYLCARDTRVNALISTAISDEVINSMIRLSCSPRIVIILDCCHSGRFKGSSLPENLRGEGRFVLTSSRARELSDDSDEKDGPSAFTSQMVEALLSGEVDANQDGYVSINEVYDYVLPRLKKETKQIPQRMFDKTFAEVAIGRSIVSEKKVPLPGIPILKVSVTNIEITDVDPGESLPEEIIDVYNVGGGTLDWEVESNNDWMVIEKYKSYIKIKFEPKPGKNRGLVYIRDKGKGGSKRIQVFVHVNEETPKPVLEMSDSEINFGKVNLGAEVVSKSVRLINAGGGELNAQLAYPDDWLEVKKYGDSIEIRPLASKIGKFNGEIVVETLGGTGSVNVIVSVEAGPILHVCPGEIDFGSIPEDKVKGVKLDVENRGKGKLEWNFKKRGDFFRAKRTPKGLTLTLNAKADKYHGTITITSNGGDATIDVKATVTQPVEIKRFAGTNIAGIWNYVGGRIVFNQMSRGQGGGSYTFQDFNQMGIIVSEGIANVQGNKMTLQGQSLLTGPINGTFTISGNSMSGQVGSFGVTVPLVLFKS